MTNFDFDPPQGRPEPDRELLARAHNYLISTETPMQRYVRQQWEVAMASSRVALDAWRRIYPIEAADALSEGGRTLASEVDNALSRAYLALDTLADELEGVRHEAQTGDLTIEQLTLMEREKEEHED